MTEQQIKELRDIKGFIDWCIENGKTQAYCLANIGHDCGLLIQGDRHGGVPRTDGYAEHKYD